MLGLTRAALALALAALLTLTGCGQDQTGDIATDDPSTASPSTPEDDPESDEEPTGAVDFELVDMITETGAGGKVDEAAIALGDEVAVDEFSRQFKSEAMRVKLLDAFNATDVPDGQALYGAVVAIGCDIPPGVEVTNADSGLVIAPRKVESPMEECYAPMTSVALVLVDESVVG